MESTTLISQGVTSTEFIATVVLTTEDPDILALDPIGGNITFRFWAYFIIPEVSPDPDWYNVSPLATTTGTSTTFVNDSATFNLFVTIDALKAEGLPSLTFLLSTPYKITVINNIAGSSTTFPETASFIPKSLTICFQKGTQILTPDGYKAVEKFIAGDLVTSTKASVPIKSMVQFIGKKEDGALYCLPKGALGENKPINDLYMSGEHAFKIGKIWKHMKCSSMAKETDADNIEYYHLIIDDYFAHTIVAEGVEVETCFEDKHDGILMSWACNEK